MPAKLLYLVTEDWFFCSHFLARARAARQAGYDVVVVTNVNKHGERITSEGLRLIPLGLDRGSTHPLRELSVIARIRSIYRRERPDIVHQVALKPIVYGGLALRTLSHDTHVVNAPVGMGYVFTSTQAKARLLRPLLRTLLRMTLHVKGGVTVFENKDDLQAHVAAGSVDAQHTALIRGAGVNVERFAPAATKPPIPVVALVARMLYDKGVAEFAEAARQLKQAGVQARFVLAGGLDPQNPSCIPREVIDGWCRDGSVEWLGHVEDMAAFWRTASIACLPSYREGLPKSNLEAMACGLPVVTTDVPGCRETVTDGDNGLLVPARDARALAVALRRLLDDAALREHMGARSRARAVDEFADATVVAATLRLYTSAVPADGTMR